MNEIVDIVSGLDGVLVVIPGEGSGSPELAWGDAFFYYAPDGVMPERTQPYGTIVTKNYPEDAESKLDEPGRFRVNIKVGRDRAPQIVDESASPADSDVFVSHPLYGTAGWVSVVNPADSTSEETIALLRDAHEAARARLSSGRRGVMGSPQALSEIDRRVVAAWAVDCAERVLGLFESEAPTDPRPRDAIARTRAFARGELDAAGEIRRRFVAGRATHAVTSPAAIAAARAAAQAAGIAHMGAHALGAAAYAAKAAGLSRPDHVDAVRDEIRWQLEQLSPEARTALRQLPLLGEDTAGPLGPGLLSQGVLGANIRAIQAGLE